MCGFWACIAFFVPSWNGHCPDQGLCPYSPLGSYSCHSSYSSHGPVGCYSCHVGPLGLLPLLLGFLGPLISYLPLILHINPLAIIPVMLAHWACYLFSWATRSSNFIFTSYSSNEPAGCYSCHVGPLGLLPLFLGFSGLVTSSLPLILPMGPLVVVMLTHWAY